MVERKGLTAGGWQRTGAATPVATPGPSPAASDRSLPASAPLRVASAPFECRIRGLGSRDRPWRLPHSTSQYSMNGVALPASAPGQLQASEAMSMLPSAACCIRRLALAVSAARFLHPTPSLLATEASSARIGFRRVRRQGCASRSGELLQTLRGTPGYMDGENVNCDASVGLPRPIAHHDRAAIRATRRVLLEADRGAALNVRGVRVFRGHGVSVGA